MDAPNMRAGRLKMLLVMLVCAAPVVASYLTYYVIRPEGRRNFGELVQPQQPMPALSVQTLQGAVQPLEALKGQWLLISVAGGACPAQCQDHLYFQRQLRESLGREKDRLDWVWLVSDDVAVPPAIESAVQQATVLRVAEQSLKAWLQPADQQALSDHLYLVDPMGNWMMRFPANMNKADAAKARKDLERLLRAASSWDQAGRQESP